MGTQAELVLGRLDALEAGLTEMQRQFGIGTGAGHREEIDELRQQLALLRSTIDSGGSTDAARYPARKWNDKDLLPDILADKYKELWRLWSYKARDYLATFEAGLDAKLEAVESDTIELSEDRIREAAVDPTANLEVKRFLVQFH